MFRQDAGLAGRTLVGIWFKVLPEFIYEKNYTFDHGGFHRFVAGADDEFHRIAFRRDFCVRRSHDDEVGGRLATGASVADWPAVRRKGLDVWRVLRRGRGAQ